MAVAPLRLEVKESAPLHGGLLDVAKSLGFLHDVSDPHIGMGAEWEYAPCGVPNFAPGVCDDALGLDPEDPKTFDGLPYGDASPFGVYKGVVCDIFRDDYQTIATKALERGETHAVERAMYALVLDPGAYSINGGVAVDTVTALALLEEYIGNQGAGRGFIHVGRFGATFLANTRGVKSDSDFHLTTAQGTPIINGSGYTRETTTGSQFWMWASGDVHVWRGGVEYHEAIDTVTNEKYGLAERLFAVGGDCFNAAVLVDPSLSPGDTP